MIFVIFQALASSFLNNKRFRPIRSISEDVYQAEHIYDDYNACENREGQGKMCIVSCVDEKILRI